MDIRTPVATWILARLFNEDKPVLRRNLVRGLCQASFDSMTSDDDFTKTIDLLLKEEYIEHGNNFTNEPTSYLISEKGIIAFRRQIATPLEKIKPHLDKMTISNRFEHIVRILKTNDDILKSATQLCIENAPQIIEFIQKSVTELLSYGIQIPL